MLYLNNKYSLSLILILVLSSCGKEVITTSETNRYNKSKLLKVVGNTYATENYNKLQIETTSFAENASSFIAHPNASNLEDLQLSYTSVLQKWQKVAPLNFGPAQETDLLNNINIYPTDTTQINLYISEATANLYVDTKFDEKGLPAIDYLIHPGLNLSNQIIIDKFNDATMGQRYKDYLTFLVTDLKNRINEVVDMWNPAKGNYVKTFVDNTDASVGGSLSIYVNTIIQYFEIHVREGKIAIPSGIRNIFSGQITPEKTEAFYNGSISKLMLIESLQSYQELFSGDSESVGYGIYDALIALDFEDLANDINHHLAAAKELVNKLQAPLQEALVNDPESVKAIFIEMQKLVLLLKVDVTSALSIQITYTDNDGD